MKYFIKNEQDKVDIKPKNNINYYPTTKGCSMDKPGRPRVPVEEKRVPLRSGRIKPETLDFINGMIDDHKSFGKSIDELVRFYRVNATQK